MKLRLGTAHPNHLNTNNQVCIRIDLGMVEIKFLFNFKVALIAVNVIGFDVGSEHLMKLAENGGDISLQSICDDLSFSMYVEESITDTVRVIETLKKKAVNGSLILT